MYSELIYTFAKRELLGRYKGSALGIARITDEHGDFVVLIRPTRVGDLNLDGTVSIADFITLASHFGASGGATWEEGDLNYDKSVTIADFIDLSANFNTDYAGEVFPISPAEQKLLNDFYAANVPEPAGLLAVFLGAVILFNRLGHRPFGRSA